MIVQWVLVSDSAHAQIYTADLMFRELIPIEGRIHPESRAKAKDLVSGDRGSTQAYGGGVHSAYERHTDPHEAEVDSFARELGKMLGEARVDQRFERLVLVAPPDFLGHLRAHLDVDTARLVISSIPHDWMKLGTTELAERVRKHLVQA